jgi:aminopeptidase
MTHFENSLDKYAQLCVEAGINLKENEGLIISTNIHGLALARLVLAKAYKAGAKHVEIMFSDDEMILARYGNARDFVFDNYPKWKVDALVAMYEDNYHHLFISALDPELLAGISGDIVARDQKTLATATAPAMKYRMSGNTKWCIVAVPAPAWAVSVFPEMTERAATELLWSKIFDATRVNTPDPVASWKTHDANLRKYKEFLNSKQFEKLHFEAPGTDLEVFLADGHFWMGGSKDSQTGDPYFANMPTEEVFTTPHKTKVNGTLKATKVLSVHGKLVDDFGFVFKDGKVVDYFAAKGKDVLEHLLETDEGAKFLGEVALVPFDSPISNTGILFNHTLFDENASIHFALGRAFPYAMVDGPNLSEEELLQRGANYSIVHTDFMVGSDKMSVTGYEKDGKKTEIFRNGNWSIT